MIRLLLSTVPWALAASSGLILTFAFPLRDWELAVWIWLLPLLSLLWPLHIGDPGEKHPFRLGYVAGLAFFLPNVSWVRHSARVIHGAEDHTWIGWGPESLGWLAAIGLAGYLSLYFALWAWFVARLARPNEPPLIGGTAFESTLESLRCSAIAAAAWVACEWLRGWVLSGFGWNGLGVALHQNTVLIQIADTVGVTGLAFLPVFIACIAWFNVIRLVRHFKGDPIVRTRLDFTLAMVLLLGCAIYGLLRIRQAAPDSPLLVRTLLVQPNVAQIDKWTAADVVPLYRQLDLRTRLYTESARDESAIDLVVWPENAVPLGLDLGPEVDSFHRSFFEPLLATGNFALLTGAGTSAPGGRQHNSVVLFNESQFEPQQRAHKIHLVPFGEYLPFRKELPLLETLLGSILPGDFVPGTSITPLQMDVRGDRIELIPLICFEDTVGRLARQFARPGPQILANVTNDGWFLDSSETAIHLSNALFRAVELRRPMVRSANTGPTCHIDTLGRVQAVLQDPDTGSTFIEGCLPTVVTVDPDGEMTLYARFGDAFALGCLAVCTTLVALHLFWKMRRRTCVPQPSAAP